MYLGRGGGRLRRASYGRWRFGSGHLSRASDLRRRGNGRLDPRTGPDVHWDFITWLLILADNGHFGLDGEWGVEVQLGRCGGHVGLCG